MNQTISIKGEVIVTQRASNGKVIDKITYHNTITKRLATGISNYLASYFTRRGSDAIPYIPSYVAVGDGKKNSNAPLQNTFSERTGLDGEYLDDSNSKHRYVISNKEPGSLSNENYSSVSFRTFISSDDLRDGYVIKEIGLFSDSSGNTLLSRVVIGEPGLEKKQGSAIDILWNLLIRPDSADDSETATVLDDTNS